VEDFTVPGDAEFARLVEEVSARLLAKGWKMVAAESCTGGWVAKCCTDQAGSSAWFERGYVTYSNAAKQDSLGVDAATLEHAGAVSREVALQMAQGASKQAGAEVAIAVTGVAGPDGGTLQKPVGTVWFGWSVAGHSETELMNFPGDREAIRRCSVGHALKGLLVRLGS
jgi:nicotinamide-nucleotide amidase